MRRAPENQVELNMGDVPRQYLANDPLRPVYRIDDHINPWASEAETEFNPEDEIVEPALTTSTTTSTGQSNLIREVERMNHQVDALRYSSDAVKPLDLYGMFVYYSGFIVSGVKIRKYKNRIKNDINYFNKCCFKLAEEIDK